jgi:hypothetical protein
MRIIAFAAASICACFPAPASAGNTSPAAAQADAQTTTMPVRVVGKVTTGPQRDWLDYLQVVAVVTAIGGLLLIRRQLKASDRTARQERAADHASIWHDREFRKILSPVWSFIEVHSTETASNASDPDRCTGQRDPLSWTRLRPYCTEERS